MFGNGTVVRPRTLTERDVGPKRGMGNGPLLTAFAFCLAFALSASLAAQSFEVSGTVVAGDQTPLAGVTVSLHRQLSNYDFAARMEAMAAGRPVQSTTAVSTNDAGEYAITIPEICAWWLEFHAPSKAAVSHTLRMETGDRELGPITLPDAVPLELTIKDEEGDPVSGALVRVAGYRISGSGSYAYPISQAARSNGKGVAKLMVAQGNAQVDVSAKGFVPGANRNVSWQELVAGDWSEITLLRAEEQFVKVTVDGKPAADAVILLDGARIALTRTDEEGRAAIPVPPMATQNNPMPLLVETPTLHHHFGLVYEDQDAKRAREQAAAQSNATEDTGNHVAITTQAVTGRVVDYSGEPVLGALVWSTSPTGAPHFTDAQGRFQFRVSDQLPSESHQTSIHAGGWDLQPTKVPLGEHAVIQVGSAPALKVTVRDENGEAIPGVGLSLIDYRFANPARGRQNFLRATTNAEGVGRLRGLDASITYKFAAHLPGYQRENQLLGPAPEGTSKDRSLELTLKAGARHVGWVVDENDTPVSGARVEVSEAVRGRDQSFQYNQFGEEGPLLVAFTDSEGRFEALDLAAEKITLEVSASGFARTSVVGVELPQTDSELGTITLSEGLSLTGKVVDADDNPVPGIDLVLYAMGNSGRMDQEPAATTGEAGEFEFSDLARGRYSVFSRSTRKLEQRLQPIMVPSEPLLLRVKNEREIPLRVTDSSGKASERFSVRMETGAGGHSSKYGGSSIMVEPSKQMTVRVVDPTVGSTAFGLLVDESGEVAVSHPDVTWDGQTLSVVLRARRSVSGSVTDEEGNPVRRGAVNVWDRQRGGSPVFAEISEGHYEVFGLEEGKSTLAAFVEGLAPYEKELVVSGTGAQVHDIVFESGVTVEGSVRSRSGEPVPGATVLLEPTSGGGRSIGGPGGAITSESGSFRIENVARGEYRAVASKEGFVTSRAEDVLDVSGAVNGVEVILGRGARIFGFVIGLEETDHQAFQVSANAGDSYLNANVAFDGSYELEGVPPGTVQLTLSNRSGTGGIPKLEFATVAEGDEVQVDFEYGDIELSGVVVRAGEPVAGANVSLQASAGVVAGYAVTDEFGRFLIEGLDPASATLAVGIGASIVHREPFEIVGDQDLTIEIDTVVLEGRVVGPQGESVAGARITAQKKMGGDALQSIIGGHAGMAVSDASGQFKLEMPADTNGTMQLRAQAEGYSNAESSWTVGSGPVQIQLSTGAPLEIRWLGDQPDFAVLALTDSAGNVVHQEMAPGGNQRMQSAPLGTWTLYAQVEMVPVKATVTIRPVGPDDPPNVVELTMPPTGRLSLAPAGGQQSPAVNAIPKMLRFIDPTGQPLRFAMGSVLMDSFPAMYGQQSLRMPAGTWTMQVIVEGTAVSEQVVQIVPEAVTNVVVE